MSNQSCSFNSITVDQCMASHVYYLSLVDPEDIHYYNMGTRAYYGLCSTNINCESPQNVAVFYGRKSLGYRPATAK